MRTLIVTILKVNEGITRKMSKKNEGQINGHFETKI
jgi:hypothetical protein